VIRERLFLDEWKKQWYPYYLDKQGQTNFFPHQNLSGHRKEFLIRVDERKEIGAVQVAMTAETKETWYLNHATPSPL